MAFYHGKFLTGIHKKNIPAHGFWMLPVLWLVSLIPELVLHIATAKDPASLWNCGLYLPGLFALVPALLLFAVLCLIPSRGWKHTLLILYSLTVSILCASQISLIYPE